MSLSPLQQAKSHYSVLIIGAGINGCGTFRDLCLQGVDCLLIDRGDICGGASAAPSRLIHGGLKYLETREFRLVRESAIERNRLLRNAPHYVKALETVFSSRSWFAGLVPAALSYLGFETRIKERGALLIEIGLRIYDFYSRKVQVLPDHRFFGKNRLHREFPAIAPDTIAAGLYHEGRVTHAERLGLELVQDGLAANPASKLCTYTRVTGHSKGRSLTLQDRLTGETREITADVIVNAGGAWIDKVNAAMGIDSAHMGGSKGSHLIVKHPELVAALNGRMMYFGTSDGRFNLIYPFFGNALIGSTDIAIKDADQATCSAEETDYLLGIVSEIFPTIKLTRDDVILTYCGVRPLPRSEGMDIGVVTRDHAISRDMLPGTNVPVLSLIGGKWTTFRAFSEQACDAVLSILGETRKLSTEDLPIGGGRDYPKSEEAFEQFVGKLSRAPGFSRERARALLERYGTKVLQLQSFIAASGDRPLASLPGYSSGEIAFICKHENVRRLADLLLRRTAIAMEGLLSPAAIQETAKIAAAVLGWDEKRMAAEIEHAQAELTRRSVQNTKLAIAA
jgi:glycerol-3-phosphate dehydrogenase